MVAIADELNPLAINHTAKTISSSASGIKKTIPSEEDSATTLNMPNKPPALCSTVQQDPKLLTTRELVLTCIIYNLESVLIY